MSVDLIGYDPEELGDLAGGLEAQADELETVAATATEAVAGIESAAGGFEDTYQPRAVHKAKVTEVIDVITRRAADARRAADGLRSMAAGVRAYAEAQGETQRASAENVEGIDTDLEGAS